MTRCKPPHDGQRTEHSASSEGVGHKRGQTSYKCQIDPDFVVRSEQSNNEQVGRGGSCWKMLEARDRRPLIRMYGEALWSGFTQAVKLLSMSANVQTIAVPNTMP
jgi:hypothetical protein